jgi:hydroxymethylglutaryl-CoA lyase
MQGWEAFIPTRQKISYLNSLLDVGFDTLDFGSFVSPKAIPQLRDTAEVLAGLQPKGKTKLLAIVANEKGAETAASFNQIDILGYPFSVSEIFQKRNTNRSIADSWLLTQNLLELCQAKNKELVVYVSMGFGNPYREPWSAQHVLRFSEKLVNMGVKIISLSDTIGTSNPDNIDHLFSKLIPAFPGVEFGAHLHTHLNNWHEKVEAAFEAGCRRFDGAIKGLGGCPMADDDLVGNMPTEKLITFSEEKQLHHNINPLAFETAYNKTVETFQLN